MTTAAISYKIATDPAFAARFQTDAQGVVADAGFDIGAEELSAMLTFLANNQSVSKLISVEEVIDLGYPWSSM